MLQIDNSSQSAIFDKQCNEEYYGVRTSGYHDFVQNDHVMVDLSNEEKVNLLNFLYISC